VFAFDTNEFRGHSSADKFCETILGKVHRPEAHLCVFAYSNAGILINLLAKQFNLSARPWDALVLFDPMYSQNLAGGQLSVIETKMIASSVIDHEELDAFEYDWPALRGALLQMFPTYAARFEGFQLWQEMGSDIQEPFEFSGNVACPVLLLVATCTEQMFEGVTGGLQCVPTWKQICPQAQVQLIDCRHVDIPFELSAIDKCIDFLLAIGGRVDEHLIVEGQQRMKKTLDAMSVARRSFKSQWTRSHTSSTFRTNNSREGYAHQEEPVQVLLAKVNLIKYEECFKSQGYDSAAFLSSLEIGKLDEITHDLGAETDRSLLVQAILGRYCVEEIRPGEKKMV